MATRRQRRNSAPDRQPVPKAQSYFSACSGWIDYPTAQEKILMDGELFMIDDTEVPDRTWLSRAGGSMCV